MVELAIIFCSNGVFTYHPRADNKEDRYKTIFNGNNYMTLSWNRESIEEAKEMIEKMFFK